MKFFTILTLFIFFSLSLAQFRLRCPTPRTNLINIASVPCGLYRFGSGTITTISPGKLTLIWEEATDHKGAPFRVALSVNSDTNYDSHILYDHIPHNDANAPIAADTGYKVYGLDIEIPDINCTACGLQILSFATDQIPSGSICTFPGNCTITPSTVYTSCADIIIKGSTPLSAWNYTYNPQNWAPYVSKPEGLYTQETGSWDTITGWLAGQDTSLRGVCASQWPFSLGIIVVPTSGTAAVTSDAISSLSGISMIFVMILCSVILF